MGGHDHFYKVKCVNGKTIVKSGTDFRNFTHIEITLSSAPTAATVRTTRYDVTSKYEEDPAMKAIVDNYKGIVDTKLSKVSQTALINLFRTHQK